jgi:hypothetical protein
MLCKIWGFHGSDYEEYRLLGYKNPVRTSQETNYVSATEPSRLMLYKIWGFHGGDYEKCRLVGSPLSRNKQRNNTGRNTFVQRWFTVLTFSACSVPINRTDIHCSLSIYSVKEWGPPFALAHKSHFRGLDGAITCCIIVCRAITVPISVNVLIRAAVRSAQASGLETG